MIVCCISAGHSGRTNSYCTAESEHNNQWPLLYIIFLVRNRIRTAKTSRLATFCAHTGQRVTGYIRTKIFLKLYSFAANLILYMSTHAWRAHRFKTQGSCLRNSAWFIHSFIRYGQTQTWRYSQFFQHFRWIFHKNSHGCVFTNGSINISFKSCAVNILKWHSEATAVLAMQKPKRGGGPRDEWYRRSTFNYYKNMLS